MGWSSFEEVIDFAIEKEIGAIALYEGASKIAKRPEAKAMFKEFASEERKHRKMLEGISKKAVAKYTIKNIPDMKISDYLVDIEFSPDMRYNEILILAMKREGKSTELYNDLASRSDDPEIKKLFQVLAQEETKHKLRLETEYDEYVLTEN